MVLQVYYTTTPNKTYMSALYAFFHCAKAYMRARLWDTASWPPPGTCDVRFGAYFAKEPGAAAVIDAEIGEEYAAVGAAVAGAAPEPDG